ncbi:MAG: flippase [bacterium]
MSLSKKVAWNTGIQILGRLIKIGVNFLLLFFILSLLGREGYGQYESIFAHLAFFELIADMGLNTILSKWVVRDEEQGKEIISNILGIRLFLSVIMVISVFASLQLPFLKYGMEERYGIMIATISSLALLFNAIMQGIFQVKLRMEKQVVGDIVGSVVTFVLIVIAWALHWNVLMVVLARVIGNVVWFIITWFYAQQLFHFRIGFNWSLWKKIIVEALPIGLAIVLWRVYYRADMLMLRHLQLPASGLDNTEVVGIYGLAYKILDNIIFVPGVFMVATFPILAKYAFADKERFKNIYTKSFQFLGTLAFPMLISIILLAEKIIHILKKDGSFDNAIITLQILSFAAFLSFFNSLNNGAIISLNKQKNLLILNFLAVCFNVGLNFIIIPRYSYIGAASMTSATELLVFTSSWFILRKTSLTLKSFLSLSKIILAAGIMGVCLYFSLPLNFILNIIIAGGSFALALFILDRKLFTDLLKNLPLTNKSA